MANKGKPWTDAEERILVSMYASNASNYGKWTIIGKTLGKTPEAVRGYWRINGFKLTARLQASPYPRYDQPLEMDGNALVLPDPEFPFHHADFINRCLDVSQAWGVRQCIIAGDMLHFDSLGDWSPNWQKQNGHGVLDEEQEHELVEFFRTLGSKQQERAFGLLDKIGTKQADGDPNVSEELSVARKAVKALHECFDKVDIVVGNHDGRIMNQLHSPMFPSEITRLIDAQDWRIAPYYFSYLTSNGEKFVISHPKSASKSSVETIAAKVQMHVIAGHSHLLRFGWDISGKFYAIMSGCCVDEFRLPYAAQRHTTSPAHHLGATIVRDGVPYLLHERVDWKRLESMK
jgi:hypothetical protein